MDSAMPEQLASRSPTWPALLSASFPAASTSAPKARRTIRDAVEGRLDPDVLDTVLLLTTELVSNAAACAPTPFDLRISCEKDVLLVEVADTNPALPRPAGYDPDARSGRGLLLVDALADSWGATPASPRGKIVWFALQT